MIWFPLGLFILLIVLGMTFIPASKRGPNFILGCICVLLASFLVSFLYSFIKNSMPLTDDTRGIMAHYMVHDHLFFYFPGAVIVLLCMMFFRKDTTEGESRAISFVFLCFYMILAMLATFFYSQHGYWADPYFLFFLTGSRVLQCIMIAYAAPFLLFRPYQVRKVVSAASILLTVPFATSFISYLYYTCRSSRALQFMVALYIVALAVIIALSYIFRRNEA